MVTTYLHSCPSTRRWSPTHPPTYLLGDGHLHPFIWEGMVTYLLIPGRMASYVPIWKESIYLYIYPSKKRWSPTYLFRRRWSPTYLSTRRWLPLPIYLGGGGRPSTYLRKDDHQSTYFDGAYLLIYLPSIWEEIATHLFI